MKEIKDQINYLQSLNQNSGLHSHVQRTSDAEVLQGLVLAILLTASHQTRHLVLSENDLATAEVSQRNVGNMEVTLSDGAGL